MIQFPTSSMPVLLVMPRAIVRPSNVFSSGVVEAMCMPSIRTFWTLCARTARDGPSIRDALCSGSRCQFASKPP